MRGRRRVNREMRCKEEKKKREPPFPFQSTFRCQKIEILVLHRKATKNDKKNFISLPTLSLTLSVSRWRSLDKFFFHSKIFTNICGRGAMIICIASLTKRTKIVVWWIFIYDEELFSDIRGFNTYTFELSQHLIRLLSVQQLACLHSTRYINILKHLILLITLP